MVNQITSTEAEMEASGELVEKIMLTWDKWKIDLSHTRNNYAYKFSPWWSGETEGCRLELKK